MSEAPTRTRRLTDERRHLVGVAACRRAIERGGHRAAHFSTPSAIWFSSATSDRRANLGANCLLIPEGGGTGLHWRLILAVPDWADPPLDVPTDGSNPPAKG